jgi:prevent-host-death family protein
MQTVSVFDAKTHFSRLIEQIASGAEQEIVISRNGRPVARVVPIEKNVASRIGVAKGEFAVPDNIDTNNAEIVAIFAGEA